MKLLATSLIALFVLAFSTLAPASSPIPKAPALATDAHILMDARTGRVLAEKNADDRLGPASLTKIMTAYVVYSSLERGQIALDDEVVVSEAAWRTGGSRMFLEVGSRVLVDQLLDGMVIQSGNDASLTLAEHVGGSEGAFVELMNTYAERLGMENTRFGNPHGLPHPDQYTSARDMAILAKAMIGEFPQHYQRYSQREFSYDGIKQYNRNQLLWNDDSVDGMKTGYTSETGYALVSSAQRDDMRLIGVVMGAPSPQRRISDSRSLLNWGFRFFDTHELFMVGEEIEETRVWEGVVDTLALGPQEDLVVTLPRGEYDNLQAQMDLAGPIVAPVGRGDVLGRVEITLDGEVLAELPVIALDEVEQAGFFARMYDRALRWFEE